MKIYYDRENNRLVYIGESTSPDFWDSHWDVENLREKIIKGKKSRFVLRTLQKYIPDKKGKILEGGCGIGEVIYCMHAHGYRAIGMDFAKKTIQRVKETIPELDVRVGDVRDLPFLDDYFVGYWSIGVIEHFWDGYYVIIKEMRRVLISGGYVFLTFPSMSPLRKLKAKIGLYEESKGGEEKEGFYQFVLDPDRVTRDLKASGFELIEKRAQSGLKGFKDEVRIFKPLVQELYDYQGESFWILGFRYVLDRLLAIFAGHTIFLLLRNTK